ncbi:MAG TPA: BatA domain-containing protein [Planctomycetota bacterium]|nr:BatA domain-containing protein [Planctomycetota bacterium]HRR79525.1 BatA domain-containing protein [Planctomycetota bacterium]HRT94502.1 BatA domain-containing protein [Planctomycetota bacterium]
MSLLFPGMLLGLVALAIPVALHLIARHKYQVQDFPTIQFLRADERTNVFAMRLVDVGQLLLRLAVLALLALAMARLFTAWTPFGPAARNLVVVVDCSASMQALGTRPADGRPAPLMDLAKAQADALLREVAAPSRCALIAAAQDAEPIVPLHPAPHEAIRALSGLAATDGAGRGLVRAVAAGCDLLRGRREARSQIVVLTDLAASAFEARNSEDLRRIRDAQAELGRKLEIVLLDLAGAQADNLAILEARVRGSRVQMGDDAHIVARVLNAGTAERKAKLQLAVGERREPLIKEIALAPGGEADVDLTLRATRAGQAIAEVCLDGDDGRPGDNRFAVPLDVADARRVLIVHDAAPPAEGRAEPGLPSGLSEIRNPRSAGRSEGLLDGVRILRFALNPGRELGQPHGTGIHTTAVTPEALAGQPLSKYDVIVLHDVSTLSEQALKDLEAFARQGRALLFVCGGGTHAMKFNRTFASLSPAQVGNERTLDPPIGLRPAGAQHPVLAPFRDRLKGDLSAVRFAAVRELRQLAPTASAMLVGTDGAPLAAEMAVGQGRAALLAFGFELDRGNLARTRVFPALMWQLLGYLSGDLRPRRPDVLTAARPAVLDVSEPAFAFLDELELSPRGAPASPLRLAIGPDRTLLVPSLPVGHYALQKPSEGAARRAATGRPLAVNHDPRESRTERITEAELADLFGQGVRVAAAGEPLRLTPAGGELWPLLAALLFIAYALEGLIGWALNARRERQRSQEASQ